MANTLQNPVVVQADYANAAHAAAIISVLDTYARDPMGGGQPLHSKVKTHLVAEMAGRPHLFSVLAFFGNEPIGLVNCVEGFSTFACRPLVNIHDIAVIPAYRGQGIATKMLTQVEHMRAHAAPASSRSKFSKAITAPPSCMQQADSARINSIRPWGARIFYRSGWIKLRCTKT